jgi:hypothetical protein
MIKYTKPTLHKLEEIFHDLKYIIRYEKGTFNSGYCIVEDTHVVVVNRFFDTEGRVTVLLEILNSIILDDSQLNEKHRHFYKNLLRNQELALRDSGNSTLNQI